MALHGIAMIQTYDTSRQEEVEEILASTLQNGSQIVRVLKYLVQNQIGFKCKFLKVEDVKPENQWR